MASAAVFPGQGWGAGDRGQAEDESYAIPVVDEQLGAVEAEAEEDPALRGVRMIRMGVSVADDVDAKQPREESLMLPESTHSFLFTEPLCSVPFLFGVGIAAMSIMCLALALINNLIKGEIPTNVDTSVRIAQYLSILIALLMEEEIPTGLYLLRRISKPYLKSKCPDVSYAKFVSSSLLRISMGYLFLVNVIVVLVQADTVIEIFYDVLALQFLQKLDDIGFAISKIDVLGKRMHRATSTPYFRVNFEKQKESFGHKWRVKVFLKSTYFINFAGFLAAMIVVSVRQTTGCYQCEDITVQFGDVVWPDAIVQWPEYSRSYPPGLTEEAVLSYSYFNGRYAKDPGDTENGYYTENGRPVYVEMNKSDRTPFDETAPNYNPYHRGGSTDPIKPAEIKYCGGRWILSHEFMRKSMRENPKESECNWLARSPPTDGFDLLDVAGQRWELWTGKITESEVGIRCNECYDESDCNMSGQCHNGRCRCDTSEGVEYLGTHCEVKLEDSCRSIIGERYNDTWRAGSPSGIFTSSVEDTMRGPEVFSLYSRPVFTYTNGLPENEEPGDGNSFSLIYSGNRWFLISLDQAQDEEASEFWGFMTTNYHAFWARAYSPGVTSLVSEPTAKDTPVGVDFYHVEGFDNFNQYGPFGLLVPAQLHNMTGRGLFRCNTKACSFCRNGLTADENLVIPNDESVSKSAAGYTCEFFVGYAAGMEEGSYICDEVKTAEQYCCPT